MIDIKNQMLFAYSNSSYGISAVMDFYDLIGKTCVLFSNIDGSQNLFNAFKSKKLGFSHLSGGVSFKSMDFGDLASMVKDNLFRADLVVIEDSDMVNIQKNLSTVRSLTKLPIVYVLRSSAGSLISEVLSPIFDVCYLFESKVVIPNLRSVLKPLSQSDLIVKNLTDGWESNVQALKETYRRDRNIDDILDTQ